MAAEHLLGGPNEILIGRAFDALRVPRVDPDRVGEMVERHHRPNFRATRASMKAP